MDEIELELELGSLIENEFEFDDEFEVSLATSAKLLSYFDAPLSYIDGCPAPEASAIRE